MQAETVFEEDVETWAELQVAALRRFGSIPGPWAITLDWENLIEEIEDVGSSRRRAVESLLENALAHACKIAADPQSSSAEHWKRAARSARRASSRRLYL